MISVKAYNFISRWQFYILLSLCISVFIAGYWLRFWSLDKGFIATDEGWYMYLTANAVDDQIRRGQLLLQWIPGIKDIYINRIWSTIFNLLAWSFFAFSFMRWMKREFKPQISRLALFCLLLGLMCVTWLHVSSTASTPSLNYTQLIHIVGPTALGLLLLVWSGFPRYLLIISGAVTATLFPIQITSLLIAPFICVAIILTLSKPFRALMLWLGGFMTMMVIYIFLIDSPEAILHFFITGSSFLHKDPTHNSNALIEIQQRAFLQYAKWLLIAFTLLCLPVAFQKAEYLRRKNGLRTFAVIVTGIIFLIYSRFYLLPVIPPHEWYWNLSSACWIAVMVILGSCYQKINRRQWVMIALLLLTPWAIGFGTDIDFIARHQARYVTPLLSFVFLLVPHRRFWLSNTIICLLLGSLWMLRRPPFGEHFNWMGERLTDQTVSLREIGFDTDVKLNPKDIPSLKFFKDNIPQNSYCIHYRTYWRTVFLLNLRSLSNDFRLCQPISNTAKEKCYRVLESGVPVYILSPIPQNEKQGKECKSINQLLTDLEQRGYKIVCQQEDKDILYTVYKKTMR